MKQSLKKKCISLFLFLTFVSLPAEVKNIRLKLPVRVLSPQDKTIQLTKNDFALSVNGKLTPIFDVLKKKKSLHIKPDLGRDFILSFHLTEYGKHVEKGISYLVTEILDTTDSLYILSPFNVYQMQVSPNKGKLIEDIQELLRKDSTEFKKFKISAENKIFNRFNSLKIILRGDSFAGSRNLSQLQYKQVSQFLHSFPTEFINFKNIFLLPNISNYQQTIESIETGEKETWWIHFQQKEVFKVLSRLKDIITNIKAYISNESQAHARTLQSGLSYLEAQTRISDTFPDKKLLKTVLNFDLNYNVIFFRSTENKDAESEYTAFSDLETILRRISQISGGLTVDTPDSEQGIKEIEKHVDIYYDLIYDWNGKIEEKQIQVQVKNKKMDLSYGKDFPKERINSLIQFLSREKVRIENISFSKNKLAFVIRSFDHQKKENFGLLKIRIKLLDKQGRVTYNAENTLRASKNEVRISLPFGPEYRGQYQLLLTACDLIANCQATESRTVTIR